MSENITKNVCNLDQPVFTFIGLCYTINMTLKYKIFNDGSIKGNQKLHLFKNNLNILILIW